MYLPLCVVSIILQMTCISNGSPLDTRTNSDFTKLPQLDVKTSNDSLDGPQSRLKRSPMIYPDVLDELKKRNFKPAEACNKSYCSEDSGYNEDYINSILKLSKLKFDQYFTSEEEIAASTTISIHNRIAGGGADDEQTLCNSEMNYEFPIKGKNKNNVDVFIVNTKEYKQLLLTHTCKNEGKQCLYGEYFPLNPGKVSVCSQKYLKRRMVAIQPDSGLPNLEEFMMPSCCVCTIINKKD